MQHGFARNVSWEIASTCGNCECAQLVLLLRPNEYTLKMWNYKFIINYKVAYLDLLQISQIFSRCNFSLPTYETWIHMPYRSCLESLCLKNIADFKQEQKQRDNDSFECRLSCCPTSYIQNLWCKMRIAGLFVSLQRSMPITGYNNLFHQFL